MPCALRLLVVPSTGVGPCRFGKLGDLEELDSVSFSRLRLLGGRGLGFRGASLFGVAHQDKVFRVPERRAARATGRPSCPRMMLELSQATGEGTGIFGAGAGAGGGNGGLP